MLVCCLMFVFTFFSSGTLLTRVRTVVGGGFNSIMFAPRSDGHFSFAIMTVAVGAVVPVPSDENGSKDDRRRESFCKESQIQKGNERC